MAGGPNRGTPGAGGVKHEDPMQEDLFGTPYSDNDTSKDMARKINQLPATQYYRQAILERLHRQGPMSDEQIRNAFGMRESTARARRWELVELRLVRRTQQKVRNSGGNPMVCWECVRFTPDVDSLWKEYEKSDRCRDRKRKRREAA